VPPRKPMIPIGSWLCSRRFWPNQICVCNGLVSEGGNTVESIQRRIVSAYLRIIASDGQGYTEYALILASIAIAAIAALQLLGGNITSALNGVAGKV
jgi:Flp pilus assembly pilin Flp